MNNILDLIGNTPIVKLDKLVRNNIYAKAEFLNPGGSIKDRVAKYMIEKAEKDGLLKKGMTIIEPTSGNTGIAVALVGRQKGYKVIIVMPENMSVERRKIIKALGAEVVLTPANKSLKGSLEFIENYKERNLNLYMPNQFENEYNVECHYKETAIEMWEQLDGKIDIFVSGIGSGGTLAGIGKFLKEKNNDIKIVAVEPKGISALLGHEAKPHLIQGIGDGFIPKIIDRNIIDDIVEIDENEAIEMTKSIVKVEGYMVGISSGANVLAAKKISTKYGMNKNIVTILADRAERYFSCGLY